MPNSKNVILVVSDLGWLAMLLVLLGFSPPLVAQQSRLSFQTIGVNEGLSHSSVYSLFQDSRGFIWAGTPEGLNRYDGREVKVYRPDDAIHNAEAAYIRDKLLEDKHGNIWLATITGIYCWEKKTDRVVQKKQLNNHGVNVFFLDENGDMWVLDVQEGFFSYNVYTGQTRKYPYPALFDPTKFVHVLATTDNRSRMWLSLYGNGDYYSFDISNGQYRTFRYKGRISFMAYEGGRLWLSDNKTIDIYSADGGGLVSSTKWEGPEFVKSKLIRDKRGQLWLTLYGAGLSTVDGTGRIIRVYSHNNYSTGTISSDNLTEIMQDRGGTLWLATDGGGISKTSLRPGAFGKFPVEERDYPELKDLSIMSLYEDREGRILFSTRAHGLCAYDIKDNSVRPLSLFPKDEGTFVSTIYEDIDGVMWLGTSSGIFCINNGRRRYYPLTKIAGDQVKVSSIVNKGSDTLLLGTSHSVKILVKKGGGWNEHVSNITDKLRTRLTDIEPAKNGYYWMASPITGVMKVAIGNEGFIVVDSLLSMERVRVIHRDEVEPDILWVSSERGLWRVNERTKESKLFNTNNGLANAFVYSILEDEEHDLWLSTNGGLIRYNRKDNTFSNYTYRNGLQSNEFNSGAFHKGKSGILYFGGVKGFNWFTGKSVMADTVRPQVIVTGITAGDSSVNPYIFDDRALKVSYGQNSLDLQVAVADYTSPEANFVRYKLEGWDKNWNTSATGEIRYSNLQPGNYTLQIYGVGSNQAQSEPQIFQITVIAPFWQQVWFRILIVLGCMAIITVSIYVWYRRKVNKTLRELEQEKMLAAERNRISRDLHDDIGGAITKISLLSELIPLQHKGEEKILEDVKMISATARDVSQSMSEIVWALHTQHDTLESLVSYLREKIREFLEPIGVSYRLDLPDDGEEMKLSGEQRRNILLVIKEALNNAVKYAEAKLITVSCRYAKGRLVFTVADDGKGFDILNTDRHGNGLKNMQKRMEGIGGDFVVIQPGKGTEIVFSVPV